MAEETPEEGGGRPKQGRGSAAPKPQSSPASFSSVYAEYARRINKSKAQLQERYAEEYLNHANAVAAAQREVEEALQHAAARYVDEVKEAWGPTEFTDRTMREYERFAELLAQLAEGEQLQREVSSAY